MNSHLPSLTVLRRDSRFWLEFHGKAQNSHGKFTLQSFSKTRLLCIGSWFHSLIFKLVVFSINQTSNLHSQFHKATNEGEKKESFIYSKHKKQEMKMFFIGFINFLKNRFVNDRKFPLCFKNGLTLYFSTWNYCIFLVRSNYIFVGAATDI